VRGGGGAVGAVAARGRATAAWDMRWGETGRRAAPERGAFSTGERAGRRAVNNVPRRNRSASCSVLSGVIARYASACSLVFISNRSRRRALDDAPRSPLARLPPSSRHAAERPQPTHPSRGRQTSIHTLHGSLCHPRVVRHLLEHVRGVLSALLPLASRAGLRGVLARAFPRRARLVEKGRGAGGSSVRGWIEGIEACGEGIAPARAARVRRGREGRSAGWAHLLARPRRGGGDTIAVHALTADENLERHLHDRGGGRGRR
jgi:hypothetical protein